MRNREVVPLADAPEHLEVGDVVGHHNAALSEGSCQNVGVVERAKRPVNADCPTVDTPIPEVIGDEGSERLIEQQPVG